jgi:hypothetical protein
MAAELIQQRFRHDPALSMCHRWNLFTWFWRMSSQVQVYFSYLCSMYPQYVASSFDFSICDQMSQFVLWVIFLCVAAITVTSSPYRTYPMSFILIIISYTICVLSIFLILSIYDWPVVRYLLGTFEYCFVMVTIDLHLSSSSYFEFAHLLELRIVLQFLSLALFGLELSQALLDNRATVLYFGTLIFVLSWLISVHGLIFVCVCSCVALALRSAFHVHHSLHVRYYHHRHHGVD